MSGDARRFRREGEWVPRVPTAAPWWWGVVGLAINWVIYAGFALAGAEILTGGRWP